MFCEKERQKAGKHSRFSVFLASFAVFLAVWTTDGGKDLKDGAIHRGDYGEEETEYGVLVTGLEEQEVPVTVTVSSRKRREKEAEQIRTQWAKNLPEEILQGNRSLNEVRTDLNLITYDSEKRLKIRMGVRRSRID